ncbi:MAG: hypothetical protein AABZ06_06540 [Bdellovibrionota bacterium]
MKKMICFVIGAFLMTVGSVLAAKSPSEELLPSPYFIDEVHCEGINVLDISESWLLSKEDVDAAKKVEGKETCENLLKAFGVEKYMWLSPDDLERIDTLIKQSGYFEEVDLSIKKSELKNHVHAFLKVKPVPNFLKSITNDFKFYSGKEQDSSRIYNRFAGEITNRFYAPNSIDTFGLSIEGTGASAVYNTMPGALTADDASKFQKRNFYLGDLYWKRHGTITQHFSYDFGMHLIGDNTYADNITRIHFMLDGDFTWKKQENILRGVTYFGPAYIFSTTTPYRANDTSTSVFFPGLVSGYNYGQDFGNNLNFKIGGYATSQDRIIGDYDLNGQYLLSVLDSFITGGFKFRVGHNSLLPQDQIPLSGTARDDIFIGLGKVLSTGPTKQQVSAIFGTDLVNYAQSSSTYNQSSDYVALRYKLVGAEWNVNIRAGYYFQRNY